MKFKKRYGIILAMGLLFIFNSYYPSWLITGSYTSSISNTFATNGIENNEKLELFEDGTFKGDSWGEGTWQLEHGLKGTEIKFTFGAFNEEGFSSYFYRKLFFSKPRIVLFRDLNSEFIKN